MTHFWATSGHLLLDRAARRRARRHRRFSQGLSGAARGACRPTMPAPAERALHARLMDAAAGRRSRRRDSRPSPMRMRARTGASCSAGATGSLAEPTLEARLCPHHPRGRRPACRRSSSTSSCTSSCAARSTRRRIPSWCARPNACSGPSASASMRARSLLADAEIIEGHEADRHASPLLAMLGGPAVDLARHPQARQCRPVLAAFRRVRHGARSRREARPAGPRSARRWRALGRAPSTASMSRSSRSRR